MRFNHVNVVRGGDIFSSSCTSIVVTTNSVGVMGAGIARQAAQLYPQLPGILRGICTDVPRGCLHVPHVEPVSADRNVILLPTKSDWRRPSRVSYVEHGLKWLVSWHSELGSIALPPLGCGLGGLNFGQDLRPLLIEYLPLIESPIELYLPEEK